jgi:hypothetical protein
MKGTFRLAAALACLALTGASKPMLVPDVSARHIEIGKSGFERFVALAARRHSALYGLFAVLLSLGLGWSAAAAFRRRF